MKLVDVNRTGASRRFGVAGLVAGAAAGALACCGVALGAHTATKATQVTVTAGKPSEFKFKLSKTKVAAGKVTFSVTNGGAIMHSFKLCTSSKGGNANSCAGKGTKILGPKAKATLTLTLTKGKHEYLCMVPGHAAAGMKGVITVT
jgi:uncharacterized cupredoxin-like copper-binding protein